MALDLQIQQLVVADSRHYKVLKQMNTSEHSKYRAKQNNVYHFQKLAVVVADILEHHRLFDLRDTLEHKERPFEDMGHYFCRPLDLYGIKNNL